MATLTLNNQQDLVDNIMPKIQLLNQSMENSGRKEIWKKIGREKRSKWVSSGRDPIMTLLYTIYRNLYHNYFGPKLFNQAEFEQ